MIGIIFQFGGEVVETKVIGTQVYLRTSTFGSQFVSLDSLYFSKAGVVKEHPDLEGDDEWKIKAIARLKEKLKEMSSESKVVDYLIEDLAKHGYVAKYKQRAGFRVEVLSHAN
jgi:hypothetical protein